MRIVAGLRRGMILKSPQDAAIRPTSDRARQVVFDILAHAPWAAHHRVHGANLLDAFAGSGALGLEGLSRGARKCYFMETNANARRLLKENIARLNMEHTCDLIACDTTNPPRTTQACDIIFLDPPYGKDLIAKAASRLAQAGWITPNTLLVTESEAPLSRCHDATPYAERKIGVAYIAFWRGISWLSI